MGVYVVHLIFNSFLVTLIKLIIPLSYNKTNNIIRNMFLASENILARVRLQDHNVKYERKIYLMTRSVLHEEPYSVIFYILLILLRWRRTFV